MTTQSKLVLSAKCFDALSFVAGVKKHARHSEVTKQHLYVLATEYFSHRGGYKASSIPMSNISEQDFVSYEAFKRATDALFYGVGVEGFDGLLAGTSKFIKLVDSLPDDCDGTQYIPMPAVMKGFITEEFKQDANDVDYTCYFITDAATGFMSLMRSVLNMNTDWAIAAVQYRSRVVDALFAGGKADSYTVKGRTLAMAGLPGIKSNEIFASFNSMRGVAKHGDVVDYTKAPVLFDQAIRGLKLSTRLPAEFYPTLRKDTMFNYALRNFAGCHGDYVTYSGDDCDGDLCQLTTSNGVIPLFDNSHKLEMNQFISDYRAGELDMKEADGVRTYTHLKAKAYKPYNTEEITSAVVEAVRAKGSVGIYTDSAVKMSYALCADQVGKGIMTFEEARLIRNAMFIAIQQMSMKTLKHNSMGDGETDMMYNKMAPRMNQYTGAYELPDSAIAGQMELCEFIKHEMRDVDHAFVDGAVRKVLDVLVPLSVKEVGKEEIRDVTFSHRSMSSNIGSLRMVEITQYNAKRADIIKFFTRMFAV